MTRVHVTLHEQHNTWHKWHHSWLQVTISFYYTYTSHQWLFLILFHQIYSAPLFLFSEIENEECYNLISNWWNSGRIPSLLALHHLAIRQCGPLVDILALLHSASYISITVVVRCRLTCHCTCTLHFAAAVRWCLAIWINTSKCLCLQFTQQGSGNALKISSKSIYFFLFTE
jgi:hypothetical protein